MKFVSFVLRILAGIGGLISLSAALWITCTAQGENLRHWLRLGVECRCRSCEGADYCPAAFTGVAYPCPHYKEKDKPRA